MPDDQTKKLDRMIQVIVRAIPKERQAHDLYISTAAQAPSETTRLLFERLAEQEEQHEEKMRAALMLLQQEKAKLEES